MSILDPIITNALMTFGAGFVGATFSKAKGPGQALDDAMTLVGFEKLHEVAELKRAKREQNIQNYKDSIAQKVVAIPEENLIDPPLSVAGPALEASKYYIEEKEIREMFANLITSSMDKTKKKITHTSYVEIIKQLTPLDAENLKIIYSSKELPIMDLSKRTEEKELIISYRHTFLSNPNCSNLKLNSASLDNLFRLGLVENTYTEWLSKEKYNQFFTYPEFSSFDFPNSYRMADQMIAFGKVKMTTYGENFCATCL